MLREFLVNMALNLLVFAVIRQESDFNPGAVSSGGAQELMQLMPETARKLGVKEPFTPRQNVVGSIMYLSKLVNQFKSVDKTLVAYNVGSGYVQNYGMGSYPEEI